MASIYRIACKWENFTGAPGYSVFYAVASPTSTLRGQIGGLFGQVSQYLPNGLTVTIPDQGDILEETTGQITGTWNELSGAVVATGSSGASYAGSAGAVINWKTAAVVNGHRVRGRTFLVPLASGYETNGTLTTACRGALQTAANAVTFGSLGIWHRPVNGSGGSWHQITSAVVPDMAAVLRSRRD